MLLCPQLSASLVRGPSVYVRARTNWKFITVTYNPFYNELSLPVARLSCTNTNGKLGNREWVIIQDIPLSIMAIVAIKDASSEAFMTCWELHYPILRESTKTLAVDGAESGIVLSIDTMNTLTHGRAKELGSIDLEAIEVPMVNCGISDHI